MRVVSLQRSAANTSDEVTVAVATCTLCLIPRIETRQNHHPDIQQLTIEGKVKENLRKYLALCSYSSNAMDFDGGCERKCSVNLAKAY